MQGVWDSPEGKVIPTKTYKTSQQAKYHIGKPKNKFGYKTSYKNHNWPKRKQSLQLEVKEKY